MGIEMDNNGQDHENGKGTPKKRGRKSGSKSRFLQKAKKFGKQGKLGRGFEVDSATYDYFLRILELGQKDEFDTPEDKDIFIANAFGETNEKEVNLSSNQMISRVIENFLPLADADVVIRFTNAFTPNFRTICFDPFASHVLEKLLEVTSDKWKKNDALKDWFRNTCKYVLNNFEEFVFDNYANHIMRKVCQCLSGTVAQFSKKQAQFTPARNLKLENLETEVAEIKKVKKNDSKILKDFAKRFFSWPQFYDLFHNELTSGMVQCLLKTLKPIDEEIADEGVLQTMQAISPDVDLDNKVNLYVLEVCLSVASAETYGLLFQKYYKGKLVNFGIHEKGNYSLRKIINTVPNKETFEAVFDELKENFKKIYEADYTSIFVALAEGCKKFETKQSAFVKEISSLLGIGDDATTSNNQSNFVMLLSRFGKSMKPKEDGTVTYTTDINGTMVLQHLYAFHKPKMVVSSILNADDDELSKLAMDPKGSHVMDSYFKSPTVGEKNKEKMISKLKDYFVQMACSKFGSRVLDNMWKSSSLKSKAVIASSLCEKEAQLNSNQFAKFLSSSCGLHLYKRDPKKWEKVMTQGAKRKNEAENLLNELGIQVDTEDADTPKKKKSKKIKKNKLEDE